MSGNTNVGQASGNISPARVIMVQGPTQILNVISVLHYQRDQERLNGFTDIFFDRRPQPFEGSESGIVCRMRGYRESLEL